MVRIAEIRAGSIAEELQLEIGTRVIRVNGQAVRDGIDLTFLTADLDLVLETLGPSGEPAVYEFGREPGESLGIVPAPDKVRECANECVFCFIEGNPPGARDALWLRDDDFRLSFTYGSYVTLTNLGPRGLQRLVDQRVSPLYVSVHATEPEVRVRLLVNPRAGRVMEDLRFLTSHQLEVHTQVVLCPGWNDGGHLDRTIRDLWSLGAGVRTLSVVPVGLTRYNLGRPVRLLTAEEAGAALAQVAAARVLSLGDRGHGWCYAADELFLIAERDVPDPSYYDDWSLLENGVGALRRFFTDFDEGLESLPPLAGRRLKLVTGASMAPFLRARVPSLARATGAEVVVVDVKNRYFGETVTVAGLLGGGDIADALGEPRPDDLVLLSQESLNADGLFIDGTSYEALASSQSPARLVTGTEVTAALRSL